MIIEKGNIKVGNIRKYEYVDPIVTHSSSLSSKLFMGYDDIIVKENSVLLELDNMSYLNLSDLKKLSLLLKTNNLKDSSLFDLTIPYGLTSTGESYVDPESLKPVFSEEEKNELVNVKELKKIIKNYRTI